MTEYTYGTYGTAKYELCGLYTLAELEQLIAQIKAMTQRLEDAMKEVPKQ